MTQLNKQLTGQVLTYLDCPPHTPTLRYLNRLIQAYIRRVPFESVSRIVKRHSTPLTANCPRLPQEFWRDAMQHGFGGTCFESSFAFYHLLTALGYKGYLTVNDMGEKRGCHAAIVVLLNGRKYLVDITIPVHVAIQINPRKATRRQTFCHDFTIRPVGKNKYAVMRSHHPKKIAFTLIDVPVSISDYRAILERDYTETGNFLKSVVMNKVIDDKTTRFFSDEKPYRLVRFNKHDRKETPLRTKTLPRVLAGTFKLPQDKIAAALAYISRGLPIV